MRKKRIEGWYEPEGVFHERKKTRLEVAIELSVAVVAAVLVALFVAALGQAL